jgi:hypothetical protein
VDPDLKNCLQRQSYNLYRLNQDFLEPELFEGPHYCTRIDANTIKNFSFIGVFSFLRGSVLVRAADLPCTRNGATPGGSII